MANHSGTTLTLQAHQTEKEVQVAYQVAGAPKGSILAIAIVQKNAQSKVARGENAGRELSHVQIVRKLQSIALNATGNGTVTIALPKDFHAQNFEILGLIQDKNNGGISGAAKAVYNPIEVHQ